MNFKQYLEEGRDAPLYHGTSGTTALIIIENDILVAMTSHRNNDKKRKVVSFSRSFDYAYRWNSDAGNVIGQTVFELDQRKLAQSHKIVPYNFFYMDTRPTPARFSAPAHDYAIHNINDNEYEENVVGNIKNVNKYIIKIHMNTRDLLRLENLYEKKPTLCKVLFKHPKLWNMTTKEWVNK